MSTNRRRASGPRATASRAEAEVTSRVSEISFQGITVTVDWDAVPIQRALFAIRLVANEALSHDRRLQCMVDVYEHVLGAEQLADLYDACPDILFDEKASKEFWDLVNEAIHGLRTPES